MGEARVAHVGVRASDRSSQVEALREVVVPRGSPFASDCLRWSAEDGRCGATLVVKATLVLAPERACLSETPEPIAIHDSFSGDGANAPLVIPNDLAPIKRHPEVMLVGRAYAAPGCRAQTVLARLHVGNVDKRIEVRPARTVHADGSVSEDPAWDEAPLGYEVAGGGSGTWNPIGVAPSRGCEASLPRLAHPGTSWHPGAAVEPVGYGPLSPAWPTRAARLGGNGSWANGGAPSVPFPRSLDPLFFQAAPVDQLLEVLRPNERLVLENLSPTGSVLVTRLPGIAPSAFAERPGQGCEPVELVADTLWIDTVRRLCTLTWRGFVALSGPDEAVVFRVEKTPTWIAEAESTIRRTRVVEPEDQSDTLSGAARLDAFDPMAVLPFRTPAFLPPAPPMPTGLGTALGTPVAPLFPPRHGPPIAPGIDAALEMSNAAARADAPMPAPPPEAPRRSSSPLGSNAVDAVDLIWFDLKSLPRIRRPTEWRQLIEALEERQPDPELDDAALAESTAHGEDRRDVFEIIAKGQAADGAGIEHGLERAIREDGKMVPPLMLVAGELSLPFDGVELLRAHASALAPLAPGDDKLTAEVALVRSYLSTAELGCSALMLEALMSRLWGAFCRIKRAVSAETLQAHAAEVLLHKRKFQHRVVLGGDHVRATLDAGGALGPLPAYLPASLGPSLPLYQRLRVRLIVEVHPSVDQHESCPIGLRVVAFARNVPRPSPRGPAVDAPARGWR